MSASRTRAAASMSRRRGPNAAGGSAVTAAQRRRPARSSRPGRRDRSPGRARRRSPRAPAPLQPVDDPGDLLARGDLPDERVEIAGVLGGRGDPCRRERADEQQRDDEHRGQLGAQPPVPQPPVPAHVSSLTAHRGSPSIAPRYRKDHIGRGKCAWCHGRVAASSPDRRAAVPRPRPVTTRESRIGGPTADS